MLREKSQLATIPMPVETKSYKPISHSRLVEMTISRIESMGKKIVHESYTTNKSGEQLFVKFGIEDENNDTFRKMIGLRNSYDKSMPVGLVSGAQVIVCENGMFTGEIKQSRRHTANIERDLDELFDGIVSNIDDKYEILLKDAELMKSKSVTIERANEIFGEILLRKQDVSNITTLNNAVRLFKKPINGFKDENVWDVYNAFTEAFKQLSPYNSARQHIKLHDYMKEIANA